MYDNLDEVEIIFTQYLKSAFHSLLLMDGLEALVHGLPISGEAISEKGDSIHFILHGTSYTLLEERGHGAQGTVYKAKCDDNSLVAVKILHKRPDREERERIATWQKVNDVPQAIQLLDHGRTNLDLKNYALVSDYVDGVTLEQLRSQCAISEEVLREILSQSATILEGIHQQNVLHRDIKPSNIMVHRDGKVYITDLGISRSADMGTLSGTIMTGSPLYAAPEQLQGNPKRQSDVYSLGLTIYYLMKGEHPPLFPSLDYKRDLSFYSLEREYSADVIRIVQKMCEHDVNERYQHAVDVLRDLKKIQPDLEQRVDEDGVLVPSDNGEVVFVSSEVVAKQDIAAKKKGIRKLEDEVQKYRRFLYWSVPSACLGIASFLGAPFVKEEYPIASFLGLVIGCGVGITTLIASEGTGSDLYQKSKQLRAARKELETLEIELEKIPTIKIKKEEQRDYEQNYQDVEKALSKLRDGGTALCAALAGYYLYGGAELASGAIGIVGLINYGGYKAVQRWQANNRTKKLRTIDDKIAALESQAITVPQSSDKPTQQGEPLPLPHQQKSYTTLGVMSWIKKLEYLLTHEKLYEKWYESGLFNIYKKRFGKGTTFIKDCINPGPRFYTTTTIDVNIHDILSVSPSQHSRIIDCHFIGIDNETYQASILQDGNLSLKEIKTIHTINLTPENLEILVNKLKKPAECPRGEIAYALALLPFTSSYTPTDYDIEMTHFCLKYGGISNDPRYCVTYEQLPSYSESGYDIKTSVKIGEYSATFIRQRGILGDEDYRIRFEVLDVSDPKTVSLRAHLSLSPQDCIIRSFERFEEKPYTNDIPIGDLETDVKSRLFKHYREFQRQLQEKAPDLFKHLYAPIAVK